VSSTQFDRDILGGAQVFEVRAIYRPISRSPEEKDNLPAPVEQYEGNPIDPPKDYLRKNKNKSSGERKRGRNALKRLPKSELGKKR
jgi:hypothetical protein